MTVKHDIDNEAQLITSTLIGDAIDSDLVDALTDYFREIKSLPQYEGYNEIIDLRAVKGFKLEASSIRELARISSTYDKRGIKSRLALIASSLLAFGFAKIYEIARRVTSRSSKEVRVFNNFDEALLWIKKGA